MLKYKTLIRLFVLSCTLIYCVYGHTLLKYEKCVCRRLLKY
jgi:hypothetical protein